MLPKFAKCFVYAPISLLSADRRIWPSNIAFKIIAAAVPLLVVFFASGHNVVLELAGPETHARTSQTSHTVSQNRAFDDFAFGYLEFDWEPGRVPGFGPIYKTTSSEASSEIHLARNED